MWVRNQTLKYVKDEIKKSYNPDFYLPTTNEYIEVKGYYSDIDKEKMKLVLKYNPTVRIYMINQYDYPLVKEKKLWLEERMILSLDNCVK